MRGTSQHGRTYRIALRGELGDRFAVLFDGMRLERCHGTTVLIGEVADQAQLTGLIERVQDLGLDLLSLEVLGEAGHVEARDSTVDPPHH